jgi:GNAT superfamily N-acetyltransferase
MSLTIKPFTDTDRAAILELWQRALPLDAITLDTFESRVLLDENFDPDTLLLASRGGVLKGFVIGTYARHIALGDADPQKTRSWITIIAIDPAEDLPVVGGVLLDELELRFRNLGKNECWVSTYPPGYFTPGIDVRNSPQLLEFLEARGFGRQREALSMDAPIAAFTLPAALKEKEIELAKVGIVIRVYRREDLLEFLTFLNATMPTDWVQVERRNLRKLSEGGFSEDQITVVTQDEKIIGYCQFEGAHFGPFGVSTEFQGRGIGTVLLGKTIERMRTHDHHCAWVMWTDDAAAKVYRKFGFIETRRFAILKKAL